MHRLDECSGGFRRMLEFGNPREIPAGRDHLHCIHWRCSDLLRSAGLVNLTLQRETTELAMRILVMHRFPESIARYAENIDHAKHEVTYVSVPNRLATLPAGVPARRLQRPGTGDPADEVLAAVAGLPRPDLVIAL